MPELWTFSGVNSWSEAQGDYVDYTWEAMKSHIRQKPKRRYASRLGSTKHYQGANNVANLRSESILDREAKAFVAGKIDHPAIKKGLFRGKRVCCMLTGPKTTTKPPHASGLYLEVYWSPMDHVPNQSIFRPDTLTGWKKYVRGGGQVWPIENREGIGIGKGHHLKGYFAKSPKMVKRVLKKVPGSKRRKWKWKPTGEQAPWAIQTIKHWLADSSIDIVIVAHSQGTNIATHVIRKGYS